MATDPSHLRQRGKSRRARRGKRQPRAFVLDQAHGTDAAVETFTVRSVVGAVEVLVYNRQKEDARGRGQPQGNFHHQGWAPARGQAQWRRRWATRLLFCRFRNKSNTTYTLKIMPLLEAFH